MRTLIFISVVAVVMATAAPAVSQDEAPSTSSGTSWTLSTGLDYSSGKYGGTQSTDILVGLSDVSLKTGNFQFSASVPYVSINGPADVVVGAGGVPAIVNRKRSTASTTREGLGDLNLSATYSIPSEYLDGFEADLSGRTKLATADTSRGLSSGEIDFGFSADVSRQFDIWAPFVTFGYRVPGSPRTYSLNSAPSFSVGTSVQLDEKFLAIVSYDFDGSISSTLADSQQLFASGSWMFNDHLTLTAYAELGLSSGAPGVGTGLLVGWKIP
jgi:outer membrane scaffolding protein for murein synthesis (MipA/OmpV family)